MKRGKKPTESKALAVRSVNLRQLEDVLSFMSKNNLEEFEYESGDLRIRLKRGPSEASLAGARTVTRPEIVVTQPAAGAPVSWAPEPDTRRRKAAHRPAEAAASADEDEEVAESSEKAAKEETNLHVIKSPIVGTYYSSPSPDASPFVKVGDEVSPAQVVCIIEAMKLMNEIETEVGGTVVKVFVENGQPVEYGERLFALRPVGKK